MEVLKVLAVLAAVVSLVAAQSTPDYQVCEEGDNPSPRPNCPGSDDNPMPTYFPYPYDCTKYFECTNGIPRCIQCPVYTRWDQELLTCNHELVTPCVIVPTTVPTTPTTTPTTTTPTTTTPTTTTPTTTTPTTTTPTTTTPTTTTPTTTTEPPTSGDPATWICPEGYVGRIGHPWNCRQFYICDPGRRPCLYDCPGDLYYNPITLDCDWQENVPSCQGGTPPPVTRSSVNYRNIKRFGTEKKSWFSSVFSVFQQETTTPGPCDEPDLKFVYY